LRVNVRIDEGYIEDMNQRLTVYRKVASSRTESELETALDEIRDRYGAPPESVLNLAAYGRVRVLADRLDVDSIDREGRLVVIRFRPTARVDPLRLVNVVSRWPGATLVPPVSVKLDVEAPLTAKGREGRSESKPVGKARRGDTGPSWWTARATAGEVKSGFTKAEILHKPEADPRAEGGMFSRLEGLLRELGA
jgi:transcription-repair coupling factor (superfamily II helicase)